MTKDTEILRDEDGRRAVRLHGEYKYAVHETLVSFSENTCCLLDFKENKKAEAFSMSTETMKVLIEAFLDWEQSQKAKKEAEQIRMTLVIAEAKEIIAQNSGIKLEESYRSGETSWQISIPDAGQGSTYPIYDPDALLEQAQTAAKIWQNFQKELQKHNQFLLEAMKLAEYVPNISIQEREHEHTFAKKTWYVSIPNIYQAKMLAYHGEDLYRHVKEAYTAYSNAVDKPEEEAEKLLTTEPESKLADDGNTDPS